jgi:DNA primase
MKLLIEVNSQRKAERIIDAGFIKYKMNWQKYYNSFSDRVTYLIWYEPIK